MWLSDHLRGLLLVFVAAVIARCGWEAAPGVADWAAGVWSDTVWPVVADTVADWNAGNLLVKLLILLAVCAVLFAGFWLASLVLFFLLHPLTSIGIFFEKLNDGIACIIDDISYRRRRRAKERSLKDGGGTPVVTLEKPDHHTDGIEAATV